jgi:starvation-inducible DNA-binding protein
MTATQDGTDHVSPSSQPWLHQHGGGEVQKFGTVKQFPIGLSYDARMYAGQMLNRTLADTQILYALYKKSHWNVRGATFYQLHLLLDKHADPPRPPDGVEQVPAMLSRLLDGHERILTAAHKAAAKSAELGDDGTNDLLVSQVIRTGELQCWFLAEHLVDTPLVRI